MKRLSKPQAIAVAVALLVVAFFLFGGQIVGFFTQSNSQKPVEAANQKNSGVQIVDVKVGSGAAAEPGDQVTVHYVGTLTDGKVFDSSRDRGQPFTFTLGAGQVIRGWDEGLVGMKVGGERKLTITPEYGYGAQAVGPIPPNSTLVFDVELLSVSPAGQRGQ